ncbi:receptor-like protein EIX2 [Ziziphus jujuba]|uniref:Receptor-like protein EIX2 n=1 Tax=Ziziphus jujuba TaxID=326968 RepID=A0A6P4BM97_ZIZJJ|nr:receptor-like protein EIX2 [Ziziphus jujuba]
MALIDRLSLLDFSNNNLSGKILTSAQLQSFNADVYMGNARLCGAPLLAEYTEEEEPGTPFGLTTEAEEDHNNNSIDYGFNVSMEVGYMVAFWGVFGRWIYFKLLNDLESWIYVMAALHKAKSIRIYSEVNRVCYRQLL